MVNEPSVPAVTLAGGSAFTTASEVAPTPELAYTHASKPCAFCDLGYPKNEPRVSIELLNAKGQRTGQYLAVPRQTYIKIQDALKAAFPKKALPPLSRRQRSRRWEF